MSGTFTLQLLSYEISIVQRPASSAIPDWGSSGRFYCVCRTKDELSIVCESALVPEDEEKQAAGWRIFEVAGPFAFSEIGVLAALSTCLAGANVSLFAISTWNTDYVMVREDDVEAAKAALRDAGHAVRTVQ